MKRFRLRFKLNKYSTRNATVWYTNNYGLTWNAVYESYSTFKSRLAIMEVDINLERTDEFKDSHNSISQIKNWNSAQKMKYLEQNNKKEAQEMKDRKNKKDIEKQLKKRMNSLNS